MTQDEIIEMALNSGLPSKESVHNTLWWLETFAKLVAAKEREACANTCEKWNTRFTEGQQAVFSQVAQDCANAIRARGEA